MTPLATPAPRRFYKKSLFRDGNIAKNEVLLCVHIGVTEN